MKLFLTSLLLLSALCVRAEESKKSERKPAETARNQVLFDRVEISSGEDKEGNQVTRFIDRDQRAVCYTFRKRSMDGASMSCLPLVN